MTKVKNKGKQHETSIVPIANISNQKYGKLTYPNEAKIYQAIGIQLEPDVNIGNYLEIIKNLYSPIKVPKPGDWLWEVNEGGGETFDQFTFSGYRRTPTFLCLPVKLLPTLSIDFIGNKAVLTTITNEDNEKKQLQFKITSRLIGNERQLMTNDINKCLKHLMPNDGYCIVGLTMWDLYCKESMSFVTGEAAVLLKAGIFSFARFDPYFNTENRLLIDNSYSVEICNKLILESCITMIHETLHLFGIQHCIFFDCCMNGSNRLQERPLHLCPVDLHKLQRLVGFDFIEREKNLFALYLSHPAFEKELKFMQNLLDIIQKQYSIQINTNIFTQEV